MNIADLGSRGATIAKMERGSWFTGPDWLLDERQWPEQPRLNNTEDTDKECKATREVVLRTEEHKLDEGDVLLERTNYWRTIRVTAWVLRFISNCRARKNKLKKTSGPLVTEEINTARNCWVKRFQKADKVCPQSPGWRLIKDEHTGILKCEGRIKGYRPTYPPGRPFAEKLIVHIQSDHAFWYCEHNSKCEIELVDTEVKS